MLVLTRRSKEKIVIGDDVVVTVLTIQDGRVQLGVDAPEYVSVDRLEIREDKNKHGQSNSKKTENS